MAMQVILTQDVENLGKAGEVVSVRPGYGRNYLVPRGYAVTATVTNKNRLDHDKAVIERRVTKERATANDLATRINGMTLQTTLGNGLVISDAPGGGILIQTAGGAKVEVSDLGITIEAQGAQLKLSAGTVSINNGALTIT